MKRKRRGAKKGHPALPGQLDLFAGAFKEPGLAPAERARLSPIPASCRASRHKADVLDAESSSAANRSRKGRSAGQTSNETASQDVELLGTKEAARRLGIGASTLEKMRAQGEGPPCLRLGGKLVRYRIEDLDAWIARLASRR